MEHQAHTKVFPPELVCPSPRLPNPGDAQSVAHSDHQDPNQREIQQQHYNLSGDPCSPSEALDEGCSFKSLVHVLGGTANCCCGQCDIDLTCRNVNGTGVWQAIHSQLCPVQGCGEKGTHFTLFYKETKS